MKNMFDGFNMLRETRWKIHGNATSCGNYKDLTVKSTVIMFRQNTGISWKTMMSLVTPDYGSFDLYRCFFDLITDKVSEFTDATKKKCKKGLGTSGEEN